mgnify:CR=1 FL=1
MFKEVIKMDLKLIIIPPDNALNNDIYSYKLDTGEYHDIVLFNYCNKNKLEYNDILTLAKNEYVIINTVNNDYIVFAPDNLSERQLLYIKYLFDSVKDINMKLAFVGNKFNNVGKISCYDDLLNIYNNLNQKEGNDINVR